MSSIVESLGLPLFHLKVWKEWMQIQIDTFSLQGRLVLVKNVLDSNDGFGTRSFSPVCRFVVSRTVRANLGLNVHSIDYYVAFVNIGKVYSLYVLKRTYCQ